MLKEEGGPGMAVLDDLDLVLAKIRDWPAGAVGHAHVEPHQIRAGSEHRLRGRRSGGQHRGQQGRTNHPHFHRILTRAAFSGSPNMVHS